MKLTDAWKVNDFQVHSCVRVNVCIGLYVGSSCRVKGRREGVSDVILMQYIQYIYKYNLHRSDPTLTPPCPNTEGISQNIEGHLPEYGAVQKN